MSNSAEDSGAYFQTVLIPWCTTKNDYEATIDLLNISRDDPTYHPYGVWVTKIEGHEESLRNKGINTHRVSVDPVAYREWCAANNRELTRCTINDFIAFLHGGGASTST